MRALLLLLFAPLFAAACSCANYERVLPCEVLHRYDVIFRGRVIDHNADDRLGFAQWTLYRFRVEESFRGLPVGTREVFIDPGSFTSCYGGFSTTADYVIYTHDAQNPTILADYYRRVKDTKSRDGSVKSLPSAWKDLGSVLVFSSWECSPSREIDPNDPDLTYLRLAAQGKLRPTSSIRGVAAQNLNWPYSASQLLPVSRATVSAIRDGHSWSAVTGPDGSYVIEPLTPGKYRLEYSSPTLGLGHPLLEKPFVEVLPGGCVAVRASFDTSASIAGTVFDSAGNPAAKVRMEIGELRDDGTVRDLPAPWTYSDSNGKFKLAPVPSGRILVGVNVDGAPSVSEPFDPVYAPESQNPSLARVFTLRPDEQVDNMTVRLPPHLPFGRLYVDVVWPNGSPATGGARATANIGSKRSAFADAPKSANRVPLSVALGRTYIVSADWLNDDHQRFVHIEGQASQSVVFTRDGQVVTIRLKSPRPQ